MTPAVNDPKSAKIGSGDRVSAENPNTVVSPETVIAFPTRDPAVSTALSLSTSRSRLVERSAC